MRAEGPRGPLSHVSFRAKAEKLVDAERTSSEKGRNIKNPPWGATYLKGTRSMGASQRGQKVSLQSQALQGQNQDPRSTIGATVLGIAVPMLRTGPARKIEMWRGQKRVCKTQLGTNVTLPCPSHGKGGSRKLWGRHWGDRRVHVGGEGGLPPPPGFGRLGGRGSPAPLIDSSLIMFL